MQFGLWGYSFDYSRVKLDSTTLTSTSKPIHPTPSPFQQKVATKSKQHTILILYCSMLIRSPSLPHMIIHPKLVDNSFSGFHLCLNLMCCVCKNRVYMQYMCPRNCIIRDYLHTTKVLNTTEICCKCILSICELMITYWNTLYSLPS